MNTLPVYTKETLAEWADKIDNRLGPIPGKDADAIARLLRATAARMQQLLTDRNDQDRALADAIRETAATADELAFWKYHAIYGRAYMLDRHMLKSIMPEESAVWKEATKQLEDARTEENRERIAGVDYPKVPLT